MVQLFILLGVSPIVAASNRNLNVLVYYGAPGQSFEFSEGASRDPTISQAVVVGQLEANGTIVWDERQAPEATTEPEFPTETTERPSAQLPFFQVHRPSESSEVHAIALQPTLVGHLEANGTVTWEEKNPILELSAADPPTLSVVEQEGDVLKEGGNEEKDRVDGSIITSLFGGFMGSYLSMVIFAVVVFQFLQIKTLDTSSRTQEDTGTDEISMDSIDMEDEDSEEDENDIRTTRRPSPPMQLFDFGRGAFQRRASTLPASVMDESELEPGTDTGNGVGLGRSNCGPPLEMFSASLRDWSEASRYSTLDRGLSQRSLEEGQEIVAGVLV
jgi:hypothetical protein